MKRQLTEHEQVSSRGTEKRVSLIRRVALAVDFCSLLWTSLSAKIFQRHGRRDKPSRKGDGGERSVTSSSARYKHEHVYGVSRGPDSAAAEFGFFAPIKHRHSLVSTAVTHCSRNDNNNLHSSYIDVSSV